MKTHMLTVLMPLYNCSSYVSYAISSILNQSFRDFELLIIDDGSSDGSAEEIKRHHDPRIKYVRLEHAGLSHALNYGLKIASNDLIARMDADDLSAPLRLEKQMKYFRQGSPNLVLSSWYAVFRNNRVDYVIRTPQQHLQIRERLLLHSDILHSGVCYNRKSILKAGGYNCDVYEDYELWLRLKDKAIFHTIPEVLIFQRYRSDSLSRNNPVINRYKHYMIQEPYYKDLCSFGVVSVSAQNEYKGWREFFYGNKSLARNYWKQLGLSLLIKHRTLSAFIITWLPLKYIIYIKNHSLKHYIIYVLTYYSRLNIKSRNLLRKILNSNLMLNSSPGQIINP